MAITASVQSESGWIINMPDLASCHIQFSSEEGPHRIVQNQLRSFVDGLVRFLAKCIWSGSKLVCKNHQVWFWQITTSPLTLSLFPPLGCIRPQTARIILCKTRPDLVWFWLTMSGFGQTDLIQMQIRSGMFTGRLNERVLMVAVTDEVDGATGIFFYGTD